MHFKMKLLVVLICIFSCGVLCGCRKTPEEVTDRMKDYGENEQITEDVELTYCKPDELKNAGIADIDIDMGNIELPDKVDFSGVEDVCRLHMSYEKDFLKNKDAYMELFGINKDSFSENYDNVFGAGESYDDKKTKKGFNISENGFMSYYAGVTYDYLMGEEEKTQFTQENEYDIDIDDISDIRIAFGNNEAGLSGMCEKAEKWLETNMQVQQLGYHVSDAIVRTVKYPENEKESTVLSLCAELKYKGISLNDHFSMFFDDSEEVINRYTTNINYDAPDSVTFFSGGDGKIKLDSAESLEKIVDFKSAVKLVNKTMADFNKLKIEKILPLYTIYSIYNVGKHKYISQPGRKVEARPVYAFLFDKKEENEDLGVSKEYGHFVLVDMETGELTTDF